MWASVDSAGCTVDGEEAARTGDFTPSIAGLLPALEAFMRFDTPERTARDRSIWSGQLDEPLPRKGAGAEAVLSILRDVVIPNGLRVGTPGFSGWVATMPTTVPAAAHLASAVAGPLCVGIQAFNLLEALALRWLADLLGVPSTYQGIFTSGGSIANLIGLGAARQFACEQRGIDPARNGLGELSDPRIYASTEVHHCIYRASGVLGLGRQAVVPIATDDALRLDLPVLKETLQRDIARGCTPIAVVANAGTISAGVIDPIPELSEFCHERGIWLHVDGAYGLFGVLDPAVAHLYGNLGAIDSMVVDPHKWLATSMGCGSVFVRDGALLARAFTLEPAVYVEESQPVWNPESPATSQFDEFGYSFHHLGLEHSLPSRGVEVWAALKEMGSDGVRDRICRHNQYARYLADRVHQSSVLELVAPVTLSTCCFRYVPESLRGHTGHTRTEALNRLNRTVLGRVRARGRSAPSGTMIADAFVIRPCFINPRTMLEDVDILVDEVEVCGAETWAFTKGDQ